MPNLLSPPDLGNYDRTQRARTFHTVAWATIAVVTVVLFPLALINPGTSVRALLTIAFVDLLGLGLIAINRLGWTRTASWLLVGGLLARVTVGALDQGGIRSPGIGALLLFPLMAGVLLGERAGVMTAIVAATVGLGLVAVEAAGLLPAQTVVYSPLALWLIFTMYLGVVLWLVWLATRALTSGLRRAQVELVERRQAERRLALALEAGAIGTWEQGVGELAFHANERAMRMFGLDGRPGDPVDIAVWAGLIHPADRTTAMAALQGLAGGANMVQTEYRITRPDGLQRHIDAAGISMLDEQSRVERLVGTVVDVTARKEMELERERLVRDLRERVKELGLLHAASKLLHDRSLDRPLLEALVVMMPSAWLYPECCEARIQFRDLSVTTPGWRDSPWRQAATFTTAGGDGVVEVCYLEERPPADEGPFLAEERALIDSLADMLRTYLDRELAERQRRDLEGHLRQAQKMDALGTLAGGIAHDFNNILSAIVGNTSMALQDAGSGPLGEYLSEIAKAAARATDLVKRILLFSRRGEGESQRRVIDLVPPIEEALALLRASLPASVEIRPTFASGLPQVSADATQIHQVIMNLGTNAGYAMRQRGGVLSVDVDRVVVDEPTASADADLQPGVHLRVTIRDTGSGISKEILGRLFEPFFTTKGVEGTGLGLSVVHGIVREHEGAITVESELGRGTVFRILIPAAVQATAASSSPTAAIVRGRGEHVMYVDDEEALGLITTRVLTRMGYRCSAYSNVHEALQAFRGDPEGFDAVITDLAMPIMTGVEFAQRLRDIRADVPIAIASGYSSAATDAAARDAVDVRIQKPVAPEALSDALQRLLPSS